MKYLFFLLLPFSITLAAQPPGYSTLKEITVSAASVSGQAPLNDYPLLVRLEDPTLRTLAQGGNIENPNGYDVIFTAADGTTVIPHQVTQYNGATGLWLGYVKVPVLSHNTDTRIIMYYGNSAITANASSSDTWNSDYLGVYRFEGNTLDDSNAGTDLTDFRTRDFVGNVGRCRGLFNDPQVLSRDADTNNGQYMKAPDNLLVGASSFTWSGWIRLWQDRTNWERIFDFGSDVNRNFFFTPSSGNGSLGQTRVRITNTGIGGETGPSVNNSTTSLGQWVHWAITVDDATNTMTVYRNGQPYGNTVNINTLPSQVEPTINNYFGRSQYDADHLIDADYDEMRMATLNRPAGWIATEYANQNDPANFAVAGPAQMAYASMAALPVELISFTASATPAGDVELDWSTSLEFNSESFSVEHSADGANWSTVATVAGAGTTDETTHYGTEHAPGSGTHYYRLRQTDFDGHEEVLGVRTVQFQELEAEIAVYPNPTRGAFTVSTGPDATYRIAIYDLSGKEITDRVRRTAGSDYEQTFNLEGLPAGSYIVRGGGISQVLIKL